MKNRSVLALSVASALSVALILYFTLEHPSMYRLPVHSATQDQPYPQASKPFLNYTGPVTVGDSVTSPRTSHFDKTFVVVEKYTNQLSAALVGYLQLAQVWDSLNISIVEPFVSRSKLLGIPNPLTNVSAPPLSDYFDIRAFENLLHQCSVFHHPDRHIFTFQDFLVQSSRSLVVIHLRSGSRPNEIHVCRNATHKATLEQKLNTLVNAVRDRPFLHRREEYKFAVIKTLCIGYHPKLAMSIKDELKKGLALVRQTHTSRPTHKADTASLILSGQWGLVSMFPALYSIYDPSITLQNYNCNITTIPHTELVMSFATAFFHSLNVPRPVIAVHLRFEQLFKAAFKVFKTTIAHINKCLVDVKHLLEQLVRPGDTDRTHNSGIFVQDMKHYGSNSAKIHPEVRKRGKFAVHLLENFGLKEVQFDPRDPQFKGAPTEQTFVSLVEQEALTMVDTLVLIGGGRFQEHMADRFLQTHTRKGIHFLCTRNLTMTVL